MDLEINPIFGEFLGLHIVFIAASTPSQGCFWPPPSPPNKRSEFSRSSTISAAAVAQLQREFEFSTATLASLSLTAVQSNTKTQ